jgi:hypothetical protein
MRELSLNILDIVMNSVEAESTRIIVALDEMVSKNRLCVRIKDNGRGMSEEMVNKVLDPFVTTRKTRSVGMGLSMFRQMARLCGGDLDIQSELGVGTLVTTTFQLSHLNRPPIGDMADSIINLIIGSIDIHFVYAHKTDHGHMLFDSFWLLARMAERDCGLYDVVGPAKEHIKEKLSEINSKAI